MSQAAHTYSRNCQLRQDNDFVTSISHDEVPKLKAQFFYCSPLPIDDPLSTVPNTSGSEAKSARYPARPFTVDDNEALENAWYGVVSSGDKKHSKKSKGQDTKPSDTKQRRNRSRDKQKNRSKPIATDGALSGSESGVCVHSGADPGTPQGNVSKQSSRRKDSNSREDNPSGENHDNKDDRYLGGRNVRDTSCSEDMEVLVFAGGKDTRIGFIQSQYQDEDDDRSDNLNGERSSKQNLPRRCCVGEGQGDGTTERPSLATVKQTSLLGSTSGNTSQSRFGIFFRSRTAESGVSQIPRPILSDKAIEKVQAIEETTAIDEATATEGTMTTEGAMATEEAMAIEGAMATEEDAESSESQKPNEPQNPGAGLTQESDIFDDALIGNSGTTGQPFVKLPSRPPSPQHQSGKPQDADINNQALPRQELCNHVAAADDNSSDSDTQTIMVANCKAQKHAKVHTEVPVGISRLHLVTMPDLQMRPIYWSPINDMAPVTRGTWFYNNTMYPVEPPVANQLELGYRELQPWSQTWKDQVVSALNVGAAGEEKIAHYLWPKYDEKDGKGQKRQPCEFSGDPYCAAKCFYGEVAAEGTINPVAQDPKSREPKAITKRYAHAQVIYKDTRNAFILKPNLQPSAYYGRKPLQKITKGTTVGIHVVRGFDWKAWDMLHPSKQSKVKLEQHLPTVGDTHAVKSNTCPACKDQEDRPPVTDLVLVVHGIGQKLSERVESFNFTHAVNELRRCINVELCNSAIQRILRDNMGSMMVLPVNWRSNLSFEDGGLMREGDENQPKMDYSLPDVTQESLPALRKMISDVMLDIPYYMSSHKPKMIQAVIQEANRVHGLWCKNNPNFEKEGRVHVIAHSLGSAMMLEILSKQPTSIPRFNLPGKKSNSKHLNFKTTNCFFVGSPAGFFLLLEQGKLVPRRGLQKAGAHHGDVNDKSVTGDQGTFGCMALDNIYNVMHYNDPIAYRLNATVDRAYAGSLKEAQLPNATTGFFGSIGNVMRSITPGITASHEIPVGQIAHAANLARLPSTLEMEEHDFSREEIAEKKFSLLNDNGQVDWYLNSGRGPLEIQYLNMLGAHSSYWGSGDFVRMIVAECGRQPGKSYALASMKAVKVPRKI